MKQVTLKVKGMTCGGCVRSVTTALQAVAGVETIEVLLTEGLANVAYNEALTSPEQLAAVLDDLGFEVML